MTTSLLTSTKQKKVMKSKLIRDVKSLLALQPPPQRRFVLVYQPPPVHHREGTPVHHREGTLSRSAPRNPTPQRPPGTAAGMQLSGFLFLSFLVLLVGVAAAGAGSNGSATVYELLPKYGLPEGLLPDAVASYSLDGDGRFVVELARPSCYVQFGSYLVYYAQRITGTLKIGSIRGLEGIQVRRFFIWMDVDEIKVDLPPSDSIYFQVGWITKRLAVDEFRQVHSCINETAYRDRIKGLFPEPIYDIEELITGDVHVALQR